MNETELKRVLKLHKLWLEGAANGQKLSLVGANLTGISLRNADLRYVDLTVANLSYADLHNADLRDSNLSHAVLTGANLMFAKLSNANLTHAILPYYTIAPVEGAFVGWKRVDDVVFKLRVAASAKRTSVLTSRVVRVNKAHIVAVYTMDGKRIEDCITFFDPINVSNSYTVGELVVDDSYSDDIRTPYAGGIALYMTFDEARYEEVL